MGVYILRILLCQLNGGSSGESPASPLLYIYRNIIFVLIAQEKEGEAQRGEVKLLQEPGEN